MVPFLRNVTAGQGHPGRSGSRRSAQHYYAFGGRSPINDQNRPCSPRSRPTSSANGVDLPVYWGNRNWDPYLRDALRADGGGRRHRGPRCLVTQRLLLLLRLPAVPRGPRRGRRRASRARPGSTGCGTTSTTRASSSRWSTPPCPGSPSCPRRPAREAHLAFVTHSIPIDMNDAQRPARRRLRRPAPQRRRRDRRAGARGDRHRYPCELVFCSRSGPPHVPWLEPDVNDHLRCSGAEGVPGVVVVPIGFVSDHMEVDLRPRHRGEGDRREARPAVRPRGHGGGRPAVRGDGARPAPGAGGGRAGRATRAGRRRAA